MGASLFSRYGIPKGGARSRDRDLGQDEMELERSLEL
jgi:hypothetical protein